MGIVAILLFLVPIALLLWGGYVSQGERKVRVRDFDTTQSVRDPRAPVLADQSALGDQLFNPENSAPFRNAGDLLVSRLEDPHHGHHAHADRHDRDGDGSGSSAD